MRSAPIEEALHKPNGRVYPKELAESIERTVHTIRCWERDGLLPRGATPHRDSRGWRYWTPEQVDLIVEWISQRRPQGYAKLAKLRSDRLVDAEPQRCPYCLWVGKNLEHHQRMKHGK